MQTVTWAPGYNMVVAVKALEIFNEYKDKHNSGIALHNLSRLYSESKDAGLPAAVAGVLGISVEEAGRILSEHDSQDYGITMISRSAV